ncbi:hypothetical protein [Peptacetobacter sp. AB845]|uniref:hypothetical protein n=1 Tax=Peptacetobacter sp. AB845 TaxID=3388429 RepID=UPI0039C95A89
MRKENYKDEINYSEEQSKLDRKRDPAIDYSYENKGSIFRKIAKERTEKKMHKEGHLGAVKDKTDNYSGYSSESYSNNNTSDYYEDTDDYNEDKNESSTFNKAKSWVEKNASKESIEIFNNLKKEYKNTQKNLQNSRANELYDEEGSYSNKKTKSNGYKVCKKCGTQMYKDSKVCPRCGEEKNTNETAGFIISKIFKLIIIVVVINIVIGAASFIFNSDEDISYEEEISNEEVSSEEPYIDYAEYSKPLKLKYNVNSKDVLKIDKEKFEVGKEIPAGEYMFVKNEGTSLGSIKIFTENDKSNPELLETVHRNYYVKLEEGDTVELRAGTLYKADQVELDMSDENNLKSGMYRLGKDVGDAFTIDGNSKTYYAVLDENNVIITNGFVDDGPFFMDKTFIEDSSTQGEVAKYIYVSNGIIVPE